MWLIMLAFIVMLSLDLFLWYVDPTTLPKALKVTTVIVVLIIATLSIYAFPILSHFDNTVRNTFVNAFLVALINIPYTIFFILVMVVPLVAVIFQPTLMMGFALIGFSGPALLAALGWSKLFKKLEPPKEEVLEENSEDGEEGIETDSIVEEDSIDE